MRDGCLLSLLLLLDLGKGRQRLGLWIFGDGRMEIIHIQLVALDMGSKVLDHRWRSSKASNMVRT
jgi:hypothetical protein